LDSNNGYWKADIGKFLIEYRAYRSRGGVLNIPQCLAFENTLQFRVTWQMVSQPLANVEFDALTDDEWKDRLEQYARPSRAKDTAEILKKYCLWTGEISQEGLTAYHLVWNNHLRIYRPTGATNRPPDKELRRVYLANIPDADFRDELMFRREELSIVETMQKAVFRKVLKVS
jgi:hypothetical protein